MKTDDQSTAAANPAKRDGLTERRATTGQKRRYEKPVICDFLQPAVAFGTGVDFSCTP